MHYPYQITSIEQYQKEYQRSINNPEEFWGEVAQNFVWRKKWDSVLNWNFKDTELEF